MEEIKVDILRTDVPKQIEQLISKRINEGWKLNKWTTSNASIHSFLFKRKLSLLQRLLLKFKGNLS